MGAFLEISTSIPCVLNCRYCPQNVLKNCYKSNVKNLTFENFKIIIDKIPPNSTITWSAFNEPFQNQDTVKMIEYAYEQGHALQINTTLVGLSLGQYKLIKDIPFNLFGIHLPDGEGYTVFPITSEYIELLKFVVNNLPANVNFNRHGDTLHEAVASIVKDSHKLVIHNRSGLLKEGRKDFHPKVEKCGHEFIFNHLDGGCVVLPNGDCVTCAQSFNLEERLGNLLDESWNDIISRIRMHELCTFCRYAIENEVGQ